MPGDAYLWNAHFPGCTAAHCVAKTIPTSPAHSCGSRLLETVVDKLHVTLSYSRTCKSLTCHCYKEKDTQALHLQRWHGTRYAYLIGCYTEKAAQAWQRQGSQTHNHPSFDVLKHKHFTPCISRLYACDLAVQPLRHGQKN